MNKKSDYYFANIKQLYPNTPKPSALETEIWEEILAPYDEDDILRGIKNYRKDIDSPYAPTPAKFRGYLYIPAAKQKKKEGDTLPPVPASYLMQEDIKAGRCKYFYDTYVKAVNYVLGEKLREHVGEEKYKTMSQQTRYRYAVDNALFADFDDILDKVSMKGHK